MPRDPWKLTTVLWPAIIAALMPLHLPELLCRLPQIGARLRAYDALAPSRDPVQLRLFRQRLVPRVLDG